MELEAKTYLVHFQGDLGECHRSHVVHEHEYPGSRDSLHLIHYGGYNRDELGGSMLDVDFQCQ